MTITELAHDSPESLRNEAVLPAWTMEAALYAALAFAALLVRLFVAADFPLAGDEARQALASWHFARGIPDAFTGSPFLFAGNALLFTLFGASDATARFLPALFGSALVLLPALLRRELGRAGALIASAIFAFAPSLLFFSRNVNGALIAVTCASVALTFAWRHLCAPGRRDLELAALFAALALIAAPEGWTVALAVALFLLAARFGWMGTFAAFVHPPAERDQRKSSVALFVIAFVGVATVFLLRRDGLGAAFALFGAWLDGLRPGTLWLDPLHLLVLYEPIPLFLGVAALIQLAFTAPRDGEQIPLAFLAFWVIVALAAYSIGSDKSPARVVALVVPLTLLAAWYIGLWVERVMREINLPTLLWQEAPIFVLACALAAFVYILLAEFVTRGSVFAIQAIAMEIPQASSILLALTIAVAIAVIAFLAVTTLGWTRAGNLGLALLLTLLSLWTVRQSAMLNFAGALNPFEPLVARAASPNVRDLVRDVRELSLWRAGDAHTLNVVADESLSPIIAWVLRDLNMRVAARPVVAEGVDALLLPSHAPAPAEGWVGQRYRLESAPGATTVPGLLRGLLFRDVGAVEYADVVLWIPAAE